MGKSEVKYKITLFDRLISTKIGLSYPRTTLTIVIPKHRMGKIQLEDRRIKVSVKNKSEIRLFIGARKAKVTVSHPEIKEVIVGFRNKYDHVTYMVGKRGTKKEWEKWIKDNVRGEIVSIHYK